jgi:hypothetical protein
MASMPRYFLVSRANVKIAKSTQIILDIKLEEVHTPLEAILETGRGTHDPPS